MCSKLIKSVDAGMSKKPHLVLWKDEVASAKSGDSSQQRASAMARHMLARAHAKAESVVQEALEAAGRITSEAREEGYRGGHADGFEAGKAEAEALIQSAQAVFMAAEQRKKGLIDEAEKDVISLALKIAELVIKREVQTEPESINAVVKDALKRVRDAEARVRLNPLDAVVLRADLERVLKDTPVRSLAIEEDASIVSPGCVVSTARGDVDQTVSSQIGRIEKVLESVDKP